MPALQRENDMGGSIHKKAPPGFTMPLPSIFCVLFGLGLLGGTGDARSGISEADGSDPPFRGPGTGVGRCGFSQTSHRPPGVAPVRISPCGKAIEPMRKPVWMTLLGAAPTAGMLAIGAVSSGKTSARMFSFAERIIDRDLCSTKYVILNLPIDARRSMEARRIHYNRVLPHSALRNISPEQFRVAVEIFPEFLTFELDLNLAVGQKLERQGILADTACKEG